MERYREKQGDLFRSINTRDLLDSLKLEVSKKIQNLEDDVLNISEIQYVRSDLQSDCIESTGFLKKSGCVDNNFYLCNRH